MAKTIDQMTAQVLANLKTGYQCMTYPQPDSNFTKDRMDASKAAGIVKKDQSVYKGKKIPIWQRG